MTKRVISIILALVMLISIATVTAFAENTNGTGEELLFEDSFVEAFQDDYYYTDKYDYDELYYHHVDENDPESEIDWAIIYALIEPCPMETGVVIAGRYIHNTNLGGPFEFDYAIYDVQLNEFIAIEKVDVTKYNGFEKGLEEAKVGYPLGDADLDGELTIMDATYIQQALVGLCKFKYNDNIIGSESFSVPAEKRLRYVSDIDCDRERTILDATAIQLKLAEVETTPES